MNLQADTTVTFVTLTLRDLVCHEPRIDPAEDEVHVWGVALENERHVIQALREILSGEDGDRIDRLLSEQHRQQRVIAYAALRVILSRYEGRDPATLRFGRTAGGKPVLLREEEGREPVRFNLSHSHGRAVIAVARAREVGIDLEKLRIARDVMGLAQRFLPPEERLAIEQAQPELRQETFGRLWVVREAVLKAIGTGLTFPLSRISVEMSGDATQGRLVGRTQDGTESGWLIRLLRVEPGWAAAVAARGEDWRVGVRRIDEA